MDKKGQGSIEYMLLLLVMVSVGIAFFNQINGYLVANPNSFMAQVQNNFTNLLGSGNDDIRGRYKSFTIRR